MKRPEAAKLIDRCDHLGQEIERLLEEREQATRAPTDGTAGEERRLATQGDAGGTDARWEATLSPHALALLRDLHEAGLDDRYLPEPGPHPDPHSAENWQAASEARDFLRTGSVDEIGMVHLARYFRLAADRLRSEHG